MLVCRGLVGEEGLGAYKLKPPVGSGLGSLTSSFKHLCVLPVNSNQEEILPQQFSTSHHVGSHGQGRPEAER